MLNVRRPKARTLGSRGFTINTKEDPIIHSPVTDDSYGNPFVATTPGSDSGSAFAPVSPPKIQRKVRVKDPTTLTALCNSSSSFDRKSFATPKRTATNHGKEKDRSPCDTTQATSLRSHRSPSSEDEHQKKGKQGTWGKSTSFKNQMEQIKLNLPKALKTMNRNKASKKSSIDLADFAAATICIVPRHGAGIAVGRMPFERMRTSLMLHMVQENLNASWERKVSEDVEQGESTKNGKAQVAKLNTLLRNCISDKETCFVEKSQEAVRLAKDTLEVSA